MYRVCVFLVRNYRYLPQSLASNPARAEGFRNCSTIVMTYIHT
jgi:hypothetical protein